MAFLGPDTPALGERKAVVPVTEAEARDIMGDAELLNSDDYFRPENL